MKGILQTNKLVIGLNTREHIRLAHMNTKENVSNVKNVLFSNDFKMTRQGLVTDLLEIFQNIRLSSNVKKLGRLRFPKN